MPWLAPVDLRTILRKHGAVLALVLMAPGNARWVGTLRQAIKQENGFGWTVREITGRVQITRRFEDNSRSSVVTDLAWNSASLSSALELVRDLRACTDRQQLGLKEAYALLRPPEPSGSGSLDWDLALKRFRKHKVQDTGEVKAATFDSNYGPVMAQLLSALASRPVPRDAPSLLSLLRDRYGGSPGSRGRQLRIQYAAQFLRFAVRELSAPPRWAPPADLKAFVGRASGQKALGGATPLKDHQLLQLLDAIPDERWVNACALMACFGLRPVELRHIIPRQDRLHVSYVKRTARGSTAAADVPGLDPVGRPGLSKDLLNRFSDKALDLPPLGSSDADAAQSVRQYLNRREIWRSLKADVTEAGGHLSAYSFRHGFALRAHEMYGLSPRVTAAIMRHSLQTHVRHYGQWTDEETIAQAIAKATADIAHSDSVVNR